MEIVLIVAVIALLIAGAYFAHLAAKKRREALKAIADQAGWRFYPGRDYEHDDEYAHFEIFRRGHSRAAYNTLVGEIEIDGRSFPLKAGDFTYKVTSGSGKNRRTTTHRFSYLIVHLPFRYAPDLLIRREGFFDKLAGVFGFDDIDFESEEFSRKFHVKCTDRRFAYDVIHPRMMEFLLGDAAGAIDIENRRCCLSDGSKRWEPDAFLPAVEFLRRFFALWPEHVLADISD
jgi:hypothetical protein